MKLNYHLLRGEESMGTYGAFGIKIEVAATTLPNLNNKEIWTAGYKAIELVKSAIMEAVIAADPKARERAKQEREELLALFPEIIKVETLPNGYCSSWCCKHLPWFKVKTKAGVFIIGWRKRVIQISWENIAKAKTAHELFPSEDVTKEGKMIHAWSYDKAREYIKSVIASV